MAPPKQRTLCIREEYIDLCEATAVITDARCAAAILGVLEHWLDYKMESYLEDLAQHIRAKAQGKQHRITKLVWVYLTKEKLKHEELMGMFGDTKIDTTLTELETAKFIRRRHNPKNGWDRTYQYLFRANIVQMALGARSAIRTNAPSLKNKTSMSYIYGIDVLNASNRSLRSKDAIPQSPSTKPSPDGVSQTNPQTPTPEEPAPAAEAVGGGVSSALKKDETLLEKAEALLKAAGVQQYQAAAKDHKLAVIERVIVHAENNGLGGGWIYTELTTGKHGIRDGTEPITPLPAGAPKPAKQEPQKIEDNLEGMTPWRLKEIEDARREKQMAALLGKVPDLQVPTDNDRTAFGQLIAELKAKSTQAIRALGNDGEHLLMGVKATDDNARELHVWVRSVFMADEMDKVVAWLTMRQAWQKIIASANLVYAVPQDLRVVWRHEALPDAVQGREEKQPAKTWKKSA